MLGRLTGSMKIASFYIKTNRIESRQWVAPLFLKRIILAGSVHIFNIVQSDIPEEGLNRFCLGY